MPYYTIGDYYGRGDYYAGDGIFSSIGKIVKGAAGIAVKTLFPIPSAVLGMKQATGALPSLDVKGAIQTSQFLPAPPATQMVSMLNSGTPAPVASPVPPGVAPDASGIVWVNGKPYSPGGTPLDPNKVAKATAPKMIPVATPSGTVMVKVGKKGRRMNWANGRALGRAERRIGSAVKHMSKYIRWVHPKKDGHAAPKFRRKK